MIALLIVNRIDFNTSKKCDKLDRTSSQAPSYASPKLRPTRSLTRVKCRATSVAKKWRMANPYIYVISETFRNSVSLYLLKLISMFETRILLAPRRCVNDHSQLSAVALSETSACDRRRPAPQCKAMH